jgi:hypothetical protein
MAGDDIKVPVDIEFKIKKIDIEKDVTDAVTKGMTKVLQSFGILSKGSGDGKSQGGDNGMKQAAMMGAVAGGVGKLIGLVADVVSDFPPITAAMKLLKAIILILLMPLIPILKPILLLLGLLARALLKVFAPKNKMKEVGAVAGAVGAGALAIGAGATLGTGALVVAAGAALGVAAASFGEWLRSVLPPEEIAAWISKAWSDAVAWVKQACIDAFIFLKDVGVWIWEQVLKPAWGLLAEFITGLWDTVLKPAWDILVNGINSLWESIIKPAWEAIKDVGVWIWQQIVQPAWKYLTFVGVWLWQQIIKPAWDYLKNVGVWIWNIIKSPFEFLKSAIQSAADFIKKALSKIGIGEGKSTKVNDAIITPNGVVHTDPNDFIIATKNPGSLGGSGTININISNPNFNDKRDMDELVRRISMELQKNMRGRVSYT